MTGTTTWLAKGSVRVDHRGRDHGLPALELHGARRHLRPLARRDHRQRSRLAGRAHPRAIGHQRLRHVCRPATGSTSSAACGSAGAWSSRPDTLGARCPARLHGTAEFCGGSVALTLDGDDCRRCSARSRDLAARGHDAHAPDGRPQRQPRPRRRRWDAGHERGPRRRVVVTPTPQCAYRDNGRCDEPEGSALCPDGTDVADCTRSVRPCAYQNDGECDEPEGTALCDEGQDPDDCERPPCAVRPRAACPTSCSASRAGREGVLRGCSRCGLKFAGGPCFELRPV